MKKILKIVGIAIPVAFIALVVIYMFNLDMKFIAYVVDPILQKHYDKVPRKQYI